VALDVGSSSVRAVAYDEGGEAEPGDARLAYDDHDADRLVEACRAVLAHVGEGDALALSCFWHSLVALDAGDRPLGPVLTWRDTAGDPPALDPEDYHRRTGCFLHPAYWPAKLRRLADAGIRPARVVSFADYLLLRLTGELHTSVSMASGNGLYDPNRLAWDGETLAAVGLDPAQLPRVSDEPAAGVYPALGDGACSNAGVGCVERGRVALTMGTSGAARVVYRAEAATPRPGLFLYRLDERRFCEGGALSDGGNLHAWLEHTLRDLDTGQIAERPPAAHGLVFLPFLGGERSLGWNASRRDQRALVRDDADRHRPGCARGRLLSLRGRARRAWRRRLGRRHRWCAARERRLGAGARRRAGAPARGLGDARGLGPGRSTRHPGAAGSHNPIGTGLARGRPARRPSGNPHARPRRTAETDANRGGEMIEIVGGGLAAAKLVESYRDAGGVEAITMWSQDPHGPYHRPPLSKRVLRGEMNPEDALVHPHEWYAANGVDLRLGEIVTSLDDLTAETIVIATGARPRDLEGTVGLRTLDSAVELRRLAEGARTAVVIGGGFIGCEVTASLTSIGVEVTQIVREPLVFAPLQAPPLSDALHDRFRAHGVDLRLDATDVPTGADLTVAGIGVVPNVELAAAAGLEVASGVIVDERFETSRTGVYAIGDVAEFFDPLYRRHRRIEHWSNAAYHGTTLGQILAGEDVRYDAVSGFFSEEFGEVFRYFGDAEGHDDIALEGDFHEERAVLRFLAGGNVIAAALQGLNDEEQDALKEEIRAGAAATF
jgi:NADPH-dependent 2,4-dienoyl-CoA reductase/sulfur reductase-like enzyme